MWRERFVPACSLIQTRTLRLPFPLGNDPLNEEFWGQKCLRRSGLDNLSIQPFYPDLLGGPIASLREMEGTWDVLRVSSIASDLSALEAAKDALNRSLLAPPTTEGGSNPVGL